MKTRMKQLSRRTLSTFLSLVMIFGILTVAPFTVHAANFYITDIECLIKQNSDSNFESYEGAMYRNTSISNYNMTWEFKAKETGTVQLKFGTGYVNDNSRVYYLCSTSSATIGVRYYFGNSYSNVASFSAVKGQHYTITAATTSTSNTSVSNAYFSVSKSIDPYEIGLKTNANWDAKSTTSVAKITRAYINSSGSYTTAVYSTTYNSTNVASTYGSYWKKFDLPDVDEVGAITAIKFYPSGYESTACTSTISASPGEFYQLSSTTLSTSMSVTKHYRVHRNIAIRDTISTTSGTKYTTTTLTPLFPSTSDTSVSLGSSAPTTISGYVFSDWYSSRTTINTSSYLGSSPSLESCSWNWDTVVVGGTVWAIYTKAYTVTPSVYSGSGTTSVAWSNTSSGTYTSFSSSAISVPVGAYYKIKATPSTNYAVTRVYRTVNGTTTNSLATQTTASYRSAYTSSAISMTAYDVAAKATFTTYYTVTYNKGSYGTGSNQYGYKLSGYALTLLDSGYFTRTGYSQTGWTIDESTKIKDYNLSGSYSTNSNITLYPFWTTKTTNIKIDANGGTVGTTSVTATYGSSMPTIATLPSRTNYYLFGLYDSSTAGDGTQYYTSSGGSARTWNKDTSATTLYAHWAKKITYKPGSYASGSDYEDLKEYNVSSTLRGATYSRTGYTQTGWSTSSTGSSSSYSTGASITPTADLTLYPYWTANSYTAARKIYTRDTISGTSGTDRSSTNTLTSLSFTGASSTINITTGTVPSSVTIDSVTYVFTGWYKSTTFSDANKLSSPTAVTNPYNSTTTYYAVYTKAYQVSCSQNSSSAGTAKVAWCATSGGTYSSYLASDYVPVGAYYKLQAAPATNYAVTNFYRTVNGSTTYTINNISTASYTTTQTTSAIQMTAYSVTAYAAFKRYYTVTAATSGSSGYCYVSTDNSNYYSSIKALQFQTYYIEAKPYSTSYAMYKIARTYNSSTYNDYSGEIWTNTTYKVISAEMAGYDTTVTAYFGTKYTVTLNGNDGTVGTSTVYAVSGQPMPTKVNDTVVTKATRTGYTFMGYYSSTSGGTQYYSSSMTSANNFNTSYTTLYAQWAVNSYTVTLDKYYSGATAGTTSVTAFYDYAMPSATMPSWSGYTFLGYYDSSTQNAGTQYYTSTGASARTWNKTSATTLYAHWGNTITYNHDSYSSGSYTDTKYYGISTTLRSATSTFTRSGYTLAGWATSSGGSKVYELGGTYNTSSNLTLYPVWTKNTYTVTLNPGTSYTTAGTASVTATYDNAMPSATMPTRSGYVFMGYYDTNAATGGNQYYTASGTSARTWNKTSNTTLYARWGRTVTVGTKSNCTVSVSADNSNWSTSSVDVAVGASFYMKVAPTNTYYQRRTLSYTPAGSSAVSIYNYSDTYNYTSTYTSSAYTMPDVNVTVDATCTYRTYLVTYKPGANSSGSDYTAYKTYGTALTLRGETYTRSGYKQRGWSTTDGGSRTYTNGASYTTNGTATLYPYWAKEYTLTAGSCTNGGTVLVKNSTTGGSYGSSATVAEGDQYYIKVTRSGAGYIIDSMTDGTNTDNTDYDASYHEYGPYTMPSSNVTATAVCTGKSYTVTLDRQSGTTGSTSVTATYGSAMPSATMPTRTGYTFGGYYTSTNGSGTQYYTNTGASTRAWNIADAKTLYAKWTANNYTVTINKNADNATAGSTSVSATYDSAMPSATMPTREGYTFDGLFDAASGGTKYYNADGTSARSWNKASTDTLYAHWTLIPPTVSIGDVVDTPASTDFSIPIDISNFDAASDEGKEISVSVSSSNTDVITVEDPVVDGSTIEIGGFTAGKVSGTARVTVALKLDDDVIDTKTIDLTTAVYKFKYKDRNNNDCVYTLGYILSDDEVSGYSGNENNPGAPTYLWTNDAKDTYSRSPLVTAGMKVSRDVSIYGKNITWPEFNCTSRAALNAALADSGMSYEYDSENRVLTITAEDAPQLVNFKYVINGGSVTQGTTGVKFGEVITFNSDYNNREGYKYVNYNVPATQVVNGETKKFSYWSSDPEGEKILTSNITFGMRLTEANVGDNVFIAYAQYDKSTEADWTSQFQSVTQTRQLTDASDKVIADYVVNYFNPNGKRVYDMLLNGEAVEYGIIVVKAPNDDDTFDDEKMQGLTDNMVGGNKTKIYADSTKKSIAYRFAYSDTDHITTFNRCLYTITSNYSAIQGKKLIALAYIVVDGVTYYSAVDGSVTVD